MNELIDYLRSIPLPVENAIDEPDTYQAGYTDGAADVADRIRHILGLTKSAAPVDKD